MRASAGENVKSDWTVTKSATAFPHTNRASLNAVVRATKTGIEVVWHAPTGQYADTVVGYNVLILDQTDSGAGMIGAAFNSWPAVIDGLVSDHVYLVAVVTWYEVGQGFPEVVGSVRVGTDRFVAQTDPQAILGV